MTDWDVEFQAKEFLPYLPEDSQVNPGVYGFELADWLARALAEHGVITSYPNEEDWGWFLEFSENEVELIVGCSSMCAMDEGYSGTAISWRIFIEARRAILPWAKRPSPDGVVQKIASAITAVLRAKKLDIHVVEN